MSKGKGTKPPQETNLKVDLAVLEANMKTAWAKYEELWDAYKAASNDETDTAQKEAYKVYKTAKKAFTNAGGMIEETEISKETLSLAGEYAVASELCKRGIYAQLTLGTRKRTDILVESDEAMLRIQVKAKQKSVWPLIKGVYGDDMVLIFVDFENKNLLERPDFYILNAIDWKDFVTKDGWVAEEVSEGRFKLDDKNIPISIPKEGKDGWKGVNIQPDEVIKHKERWDKIKTFLGKGG